MPSERRPLNIRAQPETFRLLALLVAKLGLSQTATIELAIRRLAERERVK
jgi:hypothetical protein